MTDLFKRKPIIPKIMKEMGIYGDYILEVRGDEYSQKDIMNVVKYSEKTAYRDVIVYMKNWNYTRLGRDWWRNKEHIFESLLKTKYAKCI